MDKAGRAQTLLIRADASTQIGTGHVMRCLSLAQGWGACGGGVVFVCAEITAALEARLNADGFDVQRLAAKPGTAEDARETIRSALSHSAPWVVADGYHFGAEYQQAVKKQGLRLLLLDDYGHALHYFADFVLNQNLSADEKVYVNREPHTRLLLGTRYALLRSQFKEWKNWKREFPTVAHKVLVTLGGADPDNVTGKVVEALKSLDIEAKIVVGGSNSHVGALRNEIGNLKHGELLVDVRNMPELMVWADVAVAAGGTTSWELAFMGVPSLVIVLADNQKGTAEVLDAEAVTRQTTPEQVANDLEVLLADSDMRRSMSQRGRQLVDGEGAGRVTACLLSTALTLRRVRTADCRLIWEWANETEARAASLSSESIPWATHEEWFAARLRSPECLFYVAINGDGMPIGQIRYDLADNEAGVSVSLVKAARGQGYGAALLVRGCQQCFADSHVAAIRASIKPENAASLQAFACAGFADAGAKVINGHHVRQFVLRRGDAG